MYRWQPLPPHRFAQCLAALLAGAWFFLAAPAQAQVHAPYEYDPYRVLTWVAIDPQTHLPPAVSEQLAARLVQSADQVFGATWNVGGVACPPALARQVATSIDSLTLEQISGADPAVLVLDKMFLVAVTTNNSGGLRVGVRELDCRSRTFGEAVFQQASQPENVHGAALAAMTHAFAPVVRIELVEGMKAIVRLRAGGLLAGNEDCPAAISAGELLQPVVRRNDRRGEPRAGGIQRLPFTFLCVDKREGYRVECTIHSGVRNAVSGPSGRTERLALRVRPNERGTRLVLKSRGNPPGELVDYEVLTRPPQDKAAPTPLAETDLQGAVQLPLADQPLQLVYVRHGAQTLARVPIVPGLVPEQTITLNNDDLRLLAESYYLAVQNNLMDLVARREVLAARIRLRIENKDLTGAQTMLSELRSLASRADLLRQVESQQSDYASTEKAVQAKVDKMFGELRKLLAKHLDPKLIDQIAAELNAAKKG
jgi:hypothetical protein